MLPTPTYSSMGPLSHACNGGVAQSAVLSNLDGSVPGSEVLRLSDNFTPGIFGLKKKCLYLLVVMLLVVVTINMSLTIWIIKLLDLTSVGPGKLSVTKDGLRVSNEVQFLEALHAKEIISAGDLPLKIESLRKVSVIATDTNGNIRNKLSLGQSGLESISNSFQVWGTNRNVLFRVEPNEVMVDAGNLVVSESGGLRLNGSLKTNLVMGALSKDFRLESPLQSISIRGDTEVHIESRAGGISSSCVKDMKLKAPDGKLTLDSSKLEMKNLPTSRMHSRDSGYRQVFQLCACENGLLFASNTEGHCQIEASACKDPTEPLEEHASISSWESSF